MVSRAYIVDLVEPREVHDAHGMFKAGDYLLRTAESLALDSQIKIRFNFPDGNGTFIRGRVKALPNNEGAPYIIRLAAGDDLEWLIARAAPYAEKVARLLAFGAEKQPPGLKTRRITPPDGGAGAGETTQKSGPKTRPIPRQPAAEPPPPVPQLAAERLAPSEEQLVERIAQMDRWVGKQAEKVRRGETLQASPMPPKDLPGEELVDTPTPLPTDDAAADPAPAVVQYTVEEQIRALSPNQKKKLAISGNRQARAILMKDEDRSIHIWVMKNPGLTEDEVGAFSEMDSLSAEALTFLLQSRRWGTSPRVVNNLVLNPQTPPEAIPNLLAILSIEDLKRLVETPGVRHLVARQARRTLMERSQF